MLLHTNEYLVLPNEYLVLPNEYLVKIGFYGRFYMGPSYQLQARPLQNLLTSIKWSFGFKFLLNSSILELLRNLIQSLKTQLNSVF
jgi:hypothetical protein